MGDVRLNEKRAIEKRVDEEHAIEKRVYKKGVEDMSQAKYAVIVVAAGKGERFGDGSKTLAKLDGRAVFLRSLERFINRDDVCQTILVVGKSSLEDVKTQYGPNLAFMGVTLVEGGDTRSESVRAGLEAVKDGATYVAIPDAVRPCVAARLISDVFAEATKSGAAIPASPLFGTIKRVSSQGIIEETVCRDGLYEAQTPQVFRFDLLREAFEKWPADGESPTDEASLMDAINHPVTIVRSDPTNLKITTKSDMTLAVSILKSRPLTDKPSTKLGAFEEAQW
jgi:2-C-methyl-D-erythritol 4-phosphate cytidylyltransferase